MKLGAAFTAAPTKNGSHDPFDAEIAAAVAAQRSAPESKPFSRRAPTVASLTKQLRAAERAAKKANARAYELSRKADKADVRARFARAFVDRTREAFALHIAQGGK